MSAQKFTCISNFGNRCFLYGKVILRFNSCLKCAFVSIMVVWIYLGRNLVLSISTCSRLILLHNCIPIWPYPKVINFSTTYKYKQTLKNCFEEITCLKNSCVWKWKISIKTSTFKCIFMIIWTKSVLDKF